MHKSLLYSCILYLSCSPSGQKTNLDSIYSEDTIESSLEEDDVLRSLYLLEQSSSGENLIWELSIQTKELTLLGGLDCPFDVFNDKLAALTADPKGILWGLSEEYQIMRIVPGTLSCSAFPQLASTEDFQAESLAFIQTEEGTEFFLAGYYSSPQGASSTALAQMTPEGIYIVAPITNLEGQDTVIDIDTTPNQQLYGYRGWGNLSELLSFHSTDGNIERAETIYISTEQNFALLSDNHSHWLFTHTSPQGSQLHRYQQGILEWWMDIPFIVVGASGIE